MPDETIQQVGDTEILLRRVHPSQLTDSGGLTSAAFRDRELSVHREKLTSQIDLRRKYPEHKLAALVARDVRNLDAEVRADPEDNDVSHALILPPPDWSRNALDRFARTLKNLASTTWQSSG
jgi:hypothetical protein